MEYLIIIISAVFVNNIVLSQFLGICPFLGVSNKVSTATGMSAAVVFVITLSTLVTYLIDHYILASLNITFMRTIVFILVIPRTDGRDHLEEDISLAVSGIGYIPASDYHQLYRAWRGYQRGDKGIHFWR